MCRAAQLSASKTVFVNVEEIAASDLSSASKKKLGAKLEPTVRDELILTYDLRTPTFRRFVVCVRQSRLLVREFAPMEFAADFFATKTTTIIGCTDPESANAHSLFF